MPSHPASVAKRAAATDKKAVGHVVAPANAKDRSGQRPRIFTRSDSPGARTYADVLSSPSPPPISRQRRPAPVVDDAENASDHSIGDNYASVVDAEAKEDASEGSSVVEIIAPCDAKPSTRRLYKRLRKHRRASTPSIATDLDMSDAELVPEANQSVPRGNRTTKAPKDNRLVDAYEEDSFVELDDSDAAEIRKAVRHARRVLGHGPRYQSNVDSSPSPPSRSKAKEAESHTVEQERSSRPRIPSGVKSSPIQTRASHGIYKRKYRPDAATFSEEERALNVTPKKHRSSGKAKATSSRLSPVPSHLSDSSDLPHIFDALRDILAKPAPAETGVSLRSVVVSSSPAGPPVSLSSPSLSPEKCSDNQPISISPLKIGDLAPSPEIPSPEDPKAKQRRHALFEESLRNKLAFEVPRGRTLQRGQRRRRSSPSRERYASSEYESSPSRRGRGDMKQSMHRTSLKDDRQGKRRRHISPDWDIISEFDSPRTPKNKGKTKAPRRARSPSRPPGAAKGKKRDLRAEITPPPEDPPSREEVKREAELLLAVCRASRLQREAELRQALSDANAGPSSLPGDQETDDANAPADAAGPGSRAVGTTFNYATVSSQSSGPAGPSQPSASLAQPPSLPSTTPSQATSTFNQAVDPSWIVDFQSLHSTCVTSLPSACEVTVRDLADPALSGDYALLPPLSYGVLISWKNIPGARLVAFSCWQEQTPSIDIGMLTAAIRFSKHEHFVNPSRDSPLNTFVYNPHGVGSGNKGTIYAKLPPLQPTPPQGPKEVVLLQRSRMAIFLSLIFVIESQLMTPSLAGIKNKYIKGPLHRQEFERMGAYMCMLFKHPELVAQLDTDHNMTFGTMGTKEGKSGESDAAATRSSTHIRSKGLLKSVQPATHHRFSRSHTKAVLEATDTVPVYSAVGQNFRFSDDIGTFDQLPRHPGEVPLGSCAAVGYTASLYKNSKSQLALATNLQFVIILAVD